MERVAAVLAEARAAGLAVRAEGARLVVRGRRGQEDLARQLLAAKPALLAILAEEERELGWRIAAMRRWVPARGPIPILVAREVVLAPGQCVSCGEVLQPGERMRCRWCVQAAWLALDQEREGIAK
jgi:hypothetical protein